MSPGQMLPGQMSQLESVLDVPRTYISSLVEIGPELLKYGCLGVRGGGGWCVNLF